MSSVLRDSYATLTLLHRFYLCQQESSIIHLAAVTISQYSGSFLKHAKVYPYIISSLQDAELCIQHMSLPFDSCLSAILF
jgi:hypothetical protein